MQLTQHTDFSLRTLIYLGCLKKEEKATIKDMAQAYGISYHHLVKIIPELQKMGLVDARRGKPGGVTLARDPQKINLGQLVRKLEHNLNVVECFKPDGTCPIAPACTLAGVLDEALQAFMKVLDQYTLADALQGKTGQLKKLLNLNA